MKKFFSYKQRAINVLVTIFCTGIVLYNANAQNTEEVVDKPRRHELGLDITGFINQFLNFGYDPFYSQYYIPTYYVTYRYQFKKINLRMALGGDGSYTRFESPYPTDNGHIYQATSYSIDYRIGVEGISNLSKRWQIYYGVDFKPSFNYYKNDAPYWNGGYANGTETFTQVYGIAPLIGFRFKILKRLSITTEASFSFNIRNQQSRRYYHSVDPLTYPPIPDVQLEPETDFFTYFYQPISLFITFNP